MEDEEKFVCPYCWVTEGTKEEIEKCYCVGATRERILAADEQSGDWSSKKTRGE